MWFKTRRKTVEYLEGIYGRPPTEHEVFMYRKWDKVGPTDEQKATDEAEAKVKKAASDKRVDEILRGISRTDLFLAALVGCMVDCNDLLHCRNVIIEEAAEFAGIGPSGGENKQ